MDTPPVSVGAKDTGLHPLAAKIEKHLSKLDGISDLRLVDSDGSTAIWGFQYDGSPQSLMWNVTP